MNRSWLDWLLDAIDRVPGPRWAAYAGALIVWIALVGIAGYVDAARSFPWVSLGMATSGLLGLGLLWAMQSLSELAERTFMGLEPLLTIGPEERARLAKDLTQTPPIWAWIVLVVGAVSGIDSLVTAPESWGVPASGAPTSMALGVVVAVGSSSIGLGYMARLLHQIRVIDDIHRRAVRIDLLRLEPLYGFAAFIARAAIALIVIGMGGLSVVTVIAAENFKFATSDLITVGALLGVTVVAFVIPVRGLHDRISDEKDRRLGEVNASLAAILVEIESRVAAGDLEGAGRLNDAISAANAAVGAIARAPTWPWRPETLRAFVSAVLLPVGLWVVIAVLGRVLET